MRVLSPIQTQVPHTLEFVENRVHQADGAVIVFRAHPSPAGSPPVEILFGVDDIRTIIREACHHGTAAIQSVARETCTLCPPPERATA